VGRTSIADAGGGGGWSIGSARTASSWGHVDPALSGPNVGHDVGLASRASDPQALARSLELGRVTTLVCGLDRYRRILVAVAVSPVVWLAFRRTSIGRLKAAAWIAIWGMFISALEHAYFGITGAMDSFVPIGPRPGSHAHGPGLLADCGRRARLGYGDPPPGGAAARSGSSCSGCW
jgi:hypothetical protein